MVSVAFVFAETVPARAVIPLRTPARAFVVTTRPVFVVVLRRTFVATGVILVAVLALVPVRCATRALFVVVARGDVVVTSRDFTPVRACVALRDVADVRVLTFRADVFAELRTLGDIRATPRPVAPERDATLDGCAIGCTVSRTVSANAGNTNRPLNTATNRFIEYLPFIKINFIKSREFKQGVFLIFFK